MDIQEAKAHRMRFIREVRDRHDRLIQEIDHQNRVGCQRLGPRLRKLEKAFTEILHPVLIDVHRTKKTLLMAFYDLNQYDQLVVTIAYYGKNPKVSHVPLVISLHALDRVIQYHNIRDFTNCPFILRSAGIAVCNYYNEDGGNDGRIIIVDSSLEEKFAGHFVITNSVVVTWVGERSYSSTQRSITTANIEKDLVTS